VKLLQTLKGIQAGKIEDKFGWNCIIDQAPPAAWLEGATGHEKDVDGINVP
jgi:branched-chain amino acid aminotransferase